MKTKIPTEVSPNESQGSGLGEKEERKEKKTHRHWPEMIQFDEKLYHYLFLNYPCILGIEQTSPCTFSGFYCNFAS